MKNIKTIDLTTISAMDVYNLKNQLDLLETDDEKDELAANYGFVHEKIGKRRAAERAYRAYERIVYRVNYYGDVAALIYATGEDINMCGRAIYAVYDVPSIEELKNLVSKGLEWNIKHHRRIGKKVYEVLEKAVKLSERA